MNTPLAMAADAKVRLHRVYQQPSTAGPDSVLRVLFLLQERLEVPSYFSGTYSLITRPDLEFFRSDTATWEDEVRVQRNKLDRVGFNLSAGNVYAFMSARLKDNEVEVTLTAPVVGDLDALVSLLEGPAGLTQKTNTSTRGTRREAEERRFFVRSEINAAWWNKAVALLAQGEPAPRYLDARVRLAGGSQTTYSEIDQWKQAIVLRWSDLATAYCWIQNSDYVIRFDLDARRELLILNIEGSAWTGVDDQLRSFQKELDLDLITAAPYRYRDVGRRYEIVDWKGDANDQFVAAVEKAVKAAFDKPPVVVRAAVSQGIGRDRTAGSSTLKDFLEQVSKARTDDLEAVCSLEGRRGRTLTISISRPRKRLEILAASIKGDRFEEVLDAFDKLDLKLLKKVDSRDGAAADRRSKSPWVKVLLAILVPLAAAVISTEVLRESIPRHKLEIRRPHAQEHGLTPLPAGPIRVDWVVRESKWWDTKDLPDTTAARLLVFNLKGGMPRDYGRQVSGAQINLLPGEYDIEVSALGQHDRVGVVATTPGTAAPKPTT